MPHFAVRQNLQGPRQKLCLHEQTAIFPLILRVDSTLSSYLKGSFAFGMVKRGRSQGSPKQPVPGQASSRYPAYSKRFEARPPKDISFVQQEPMERQIRDWKIFKKDVDNYGPTDGCPGCKAIVGENGLSSPAYASMQGSLWRF